SACRWSSSREACRPAHNWLDRILPRVLDRDPAALEVAFARLFAGQSAEPILRFLDEDTGLLEELRLIRSLPPGPYLRALRPLTPGSSGSARGGIGRSMLTVWCNRCRSGCRPRRCGLGPRPRWRRRLSTTLNHGASTCTGTGSTSSPIVPAGSMSSTPAAG